MDRAELGGALQKFLKKVWKDEERRGRILTFIFISPESPLKREEVLAILLNRTLEEQALILRLFSE